MYEFDVRGGPTALAAYRAQVLFEHVPNLSTMFHKYGYVK